MARQILTATTLLLILFTSSAAQNRSAGEALAGLREIGVIVKYANADGLEPEMQPSILQMLQDRAKDRLREAEVPLLQAIDQRDMAGRPRLVFTVTLNKSTTTAPTIVVDSRLYERVLLSSDPAKEMELATWVQSGIGVASRVTTEMLLQVFDGQLDGFISKYREVNPNRTTVEKSMVNPPAQDEGKNANSLQGLNGVDLFVSFRPDVLADTNQRTQRAELQKKLQKETEARLAKAGIPKWGQETEQTPRPLLNLFITLSRPNSYRRAIEVESTFWQQVRPIRDLKKQTYAVTWESQGSDDELTDEALLRVITSQLEEFIKSYSTANPRLSSSPNLKAK